MVWSVSNRTDGRILPQELTLIPGFASGSAKALVDAGLWKTMSTGWLIVDFAATQTSRHELEVLENVRRNNREAKARERAKKAEAKPPLDSQSDVSMTRQPDDIGRKEGRQGFENGTTTKPLVSTKSPPRSPSPSPDCSWCKGADLGYPCPECAKESVA